MKKHTQVVQWYFIVGSGDESGQFHCDKIQVDNTEREKMRNALLGELVLRRRGGLVMHTFEQIVELSPANTS